jgi:D-alanyl-lipoteichoic acid acyltransferase DltB (MBOAT superfamily)
MAIGLGRMFGFHFHENFNYPYISKSVTEFYRRWHISLGAWFRDYVYFPLGGSRVSKPRWIFNLFLVWFLTGVWHGANWTFVVWGVLYFVILLIEKETGFTKKLGWFSYVYTMVVIVLARVIFRADNMSAAMVYIGNMFGVGATGLWDAGVVYSLKNTAFVLIAACIGATPVVKNIFAKLQKTKFRFVETIWIVVILVASLLQTVCSTYNPFIYFNF